MILSIVSITGVVASFAILVAILLVSLAIKNSVENNPVYQALKSLREEFPKVKNLHNSFQGPFYFVLKDGRKVDVEYRQMPLEYKEKHNIITQDGRGLLKVHVTIDGEEVTGVFKHQNSSWELFRLAEKRCKGQKVAERKRREVKTEDNLNVGVHEDFGLNEKDYLPVEVEGQRTNVKWTKHKALMTMLGGRLVHCDILIEMASILVKDSYGKHNKRAHFLLGGMVGRDVYTLVKQDFISKEGVINWDLIDACRQQDVCRQLGLGFAWHYIENDPSLSFDENYKLKKRKRA